MIAPVLLALTALRVGLIGLDSSHCVQFTKIFNDPANPEHVPGLRIVAAWKGGSPDVVLSASRVDKFTSQLANDYHIPILPTIEDVVRQCDAVMILSVDGRAHLEEARRVFAFHKPTFIDKPVAGNVRDAIEIFRMARQEGVPCYSASDERFTDDIARLRQADIGRLMGLICYGPGAVEPHVPDLYFYGIHAVEKAYTLLGPGCLSVVRTHTEDVDVTTGTWPGGRVATIWGYRNSKRYQFKTIEFGTKDIADAEPPSSYRPMALQLERFFRTGVAPVAPADTIQILAFMTASDESRDRGGAPVSVAKVIEESGGMAGL